MLRHATTGCGDEGRSGSYLPHMIPDEHSEYRTALRRRQLQGVGAALVMLLAGGAVTLGAVAVPQLTWLFPPGWHGTVLTVLILVVVAPGILVSAGGSLLFGLAVGWPRSRVASTAVMIGVASIFAGLWLLPSFGLDEQHVGYVVVGATLALTFVIAPTVLGMLVRGGMAVDAPDSG